MAYITYTTTQNSIQASIAGLATYSTYTEIYITINGQRSVNLIRGGSGYSQSLSYTVNYLSPGQGYYYQWNIKTQAGSTASDYGYIYTQSPPAPPTVGGVGSVSVSNNGEGSIYVSWGYASNAEQYRVEVSNYYSGTYLQGAQTTSTSMYVYGLPQGTYCEVKVYGMRLYSSNGPASYGYITTADYTVGGVGSVRIYQVASSGVLDVSWNYATNATGYRLEIYDGFTNTYLAGYQLTSVSYRVTGLSENSYYRIKVYGQRGGTNGAASENYGWTYSFTPAQLTNLTANPGTARGGIHMSWSSATYATGYRWEIYRGNTTNNAYYVTGGNTTSTSASYIGLAEYTLYTVKAYGTRGNVNGGHATATVTTRDITPPTINITSSDGYGRMYILFSASDAHSGLRPSNTYYTEISNANGTSYGQGSYSTNNYRTFTADGNGNAFVQDAWYYMRVVAYDNSVDNGYNSASTNVRVQFKSARPSNWEWHNAKIAGSPFNLTAAEWNSFCIKINQFRQYKSVSNYSFTNAVSGGSVTAALMNQARTALGAITTSPPSVSSGNVITAAYFNNLRNTLNNIS